MSSNGLKVTVEDAKCVQANAFVQSGIFQEFVFKEESATFRINLNVLLVKKKILLPVFLKVASTLTHQVSVPLNYYCTMRQNFFVLSSSGMSEYFWFLERHWKFYCTEDVLCWIWFPSHSHVNITGLLTEK